MASKHRRHSSVDTLGWMYTNRADEPPAAAEAAALDRSVSTHISSFRHEVFPALKRQTSLRFNPGEYFAGCFGPRERPSDGAAPSIVVNTSAAAARPRRNGHSRSLSASFLSNFGFGGKTAEELPCRALQQPAGRWIMENDEEYYLKPPAWKQALRKLRAEARRHVHPAPPCERLDYDAESYHKNFDNGALPASLVVEEDEFEVKARVLHTRLLTKLHSKRFEKEHTEFPPAKLLKSVSIPAVPVGPASAGGVRIWERRVAHRPLVKLELTRSI